MCGIFFYLKNSPIKGKDKKKLENFANKIKHRGPDKTEIRYYDSNKMVCFHRLQITDLTEEAMQPFELDFLGQKWVCMVNGEIYNYKQLDKEMREDEGFFNYNPKSQSDCEVILHKLNHIMMQNESLCEEESIEKLMKCLDGEYAVVLFKVDVFKQKVCCFTDALRVRPLFIGANDGELCITSEQKAIPDYFIAKSATVGGNLNIFTYYNNEIQKLLLKEPNKYWETKINREITEEEAQSQIRELLIENVHKKMHPDRSYGFLLSGGLDSSLVCGIAARYCKEHELPRIRTFTVGFHEDAPDVVAARYVAKHINSIHKELIFSYEEGIELIPDIIYYNESWDQTTTRASTPMGLLARYIKIYHPEIAVIYSGEVADELFRGYLYNRIEVDEKEARLDMKKRLADISLFDGLRADRVISSQGLELRLPFFSNELLNFAFSLPYEFLDPCHHKTEECPTGVEKWLLRKAFEGLNYIPDKIIWRIKNAFSDATSKMTHNKGSEWKEKLKEEADKHITDSRFKSRKEIYPYCTPQTKEDMWYRDIFDSYGYEEETIPYKWLPSWTKDCTDSSATTLDVFTETEISI